MQLSMVEVMPQELWEKCNSTLCLVRCKSSSSMVYEEMNQEIIHAIFAMIDRKLAGEKVEHTFVINTLDFYLKV
ncbi:hypothetical protein P8452_48592 [Trifolium repens]|nr:hypothetical protein P8452_48592 [Trifolium repens]